MLSDLVSSVGDVPGALPLEACQRAVCLPSSNSAYALVAGVPGAVPSLALHFVGRSAIIATGLWVAGFRGRQLVVGGLSAAAMFEVAMLAWATSEVHRVDA